MKKTIFIIIVLGIMVLGLTGCGKNKMFDIGEKSNIEIAKNDVTLSIKEGTLTKTGATLILKNDSNVDVQYGNPYEIEIKQDGSWHKINVQLDFTLPSYGLKSGESKQIELDWENGYGKLSTGEYRIIKDIDVEQEDETFESFYVSAEFTIK
jgi:hypothetical protein